jgi:hypothetical protein
MSVTTTPPPLRICIVDMNAGVKNEAIRCIRACLATFEKQLRQTNPDLPVDVVQVSPRDKEETVPRDAHLYVSSGGPGSPFEHEGTAWAADYWRFLDGLHAAHEKGREDAPGLMPICYSFELVTLHFRAARLVARPHKKFGVMPQYTTEAGQRHPLLEMFHDRIFAFEHRSWDAIEPDEALLAQLGGAVLARESRPGMSDKGVSVTALSLGPGIETTLFHPEADRAGILQWIEKPESEAAFKEAYGDLTHERMLRTISHPERIDRAHREVVPGFLRRHFNRLAPAHGWNAIPRPRRRRPGDDLPRC